MVSTASFFFAARYPMSARWCHLTGNMRHSNSWKNPLSRMILASYVAPGQVDTKSWISFLTQQTSWCCKSFLRFTYSGSCSDTARMRTWVPSTVPIIPGNWDANKKKKSWCLLIMSNVQERIWTFSQYKVVQGQWSPCELYSIIPKKSNNIMIQYHIPWIDKYPQKIQI